MSPMKYDYLLQGLARTPRLQNDEKHEKACVVKPFRNHGAEEKQICHRATQEIRAVCAQSENIKSSQQTGSK